MCVFVCVCVCVCMCAGDKLKQKPAMGDLLRKHLRPPAAEDSSSRGWLVRPCVCNATKHVLTQVGTAASQQQQQQ